MSKPSLAEAALTAVEKLTPLIRELYISSSATAHETFQEALAELLRVEQFAARRVDLNTYEQHRRAMEACHIILPQQQPRG